MIRVKIGGLEIAVDSLDELDELVDRYGNRDESGDTPTPPRTPRPGGGGGNSTSHTVLLRKFVDAGITGLPNETIGELLGKRRKAMRGAAQQWASNIKLITDEGIDPFEEVRVGTQRGLRIKQNFLDLAKELIKG